MSGTTGSDSSTCRLPAHPCETIGHALSLAPGGATINVATGTYPEQLTITKDVTIKGAGTTKTIIEPTSVSTNASDTDSSTGQNAIVYFGSSVTSGNLKNLQVNGSAASSSFPAGNCGNPDYAGVYYRDASGSLSTVLVTGVQQPASDFGCQNRADGGVYAATDTGSATNLTMTTVTVNSYQKNGITCDDVGTTCTISGSTVTGVGPTAGTTQNGIQVFGAAAKITKTKVTGNDYTAPQYCVASCPGNENYTYYTASGILVISAGDVSLNTNTVTGNNANIYAMWYPAWGLNPPSQGTWLFNDNTAGKATNNTVQPGSGSDRVPFGDGFGDGIDVDGATNVTVSSNIVTGDPEYGIALLDATNSTVEYNKTNNGAGDGIYWRQPIHRRSKQRLHAGVRYRREDRAKHRKHDSDEFSERQQAGRHPRRHHVTGQRQPVREQPAPEQQPLRRGRPLHRRLRAGRVAERLDVVPQHLHARR